MTGREQTPSSRCFMKAWQTCRRTSERKRERERLQEEEKIEIYSWRGEKRVGGGGDGVKSVSFKDSASPLWFPVSSFGSARVTGFTSGTNTRLEICSVYRSPHGAVWSASASFEELHLQVASDPNPPTLSQTLPQTASTFSR